MTRHFLIHVWKNKLLWCRIAADCPWANEVVQDILNHFPTKEGYSFEFLMAPDERRTLECSNDSARLLVREPIYKSLNIADILSN